jgi:hypothetical protein
MMRGRGRPLPGYLLACAVLLVLVQGCSSQHLERWHSTSLTEEYRAARSDEVRDFDAYLRLEDRLFTQLEREVYAADTPGPGDALLR